MQNPTLSYFDTLDGGPVDLDTLLAFHRERFGGWFMEDADADDKDDDADDADGDDSTDDADDKDDDEPDWKAKFEAEQRHKKNLERKAKKDAATIQRLTGKKPEGGSKDTDEPDVEKIKADAKAEAQREVMRGRVEDKIEAKARAFADPEDAVAVLLRSHDYEDFLDDSNKIDVEAIADALEELGEKKPHLLAQGGRFGGGADNGTRKEKPPRAKSLGDAISRHYEKS